MQRTFDPKAALLHTSILNRSEYYQFKMLAYSHVYISQFTLDVSSCKVESHGNPDDTKSYKLFIKYTRL